MFLTLSICWLPGEAHMEIDSVCDPLYRVLFGIDVRLSIGYFGFCSDKFSEEGGMRLKVLELQVVALGSQWIGTECKVTGTPDSQC